jgi:hypothetical protein
MKDRASPGRWLRLLCIGHAAFGAYVYRREAGSIASRGFVGAVRHRSPEAAAVWFVGAAFPGWTIGRLADVAAQAGDRRAVRLAGGLGMAAGIVGGLLMPSPTLWLQVPACVPMLLARP